MRLLTPARSLLLTDVSHVLAESAGDLGGRAGGIVPVAGRNIPRQARVGVESIGVEAGQGEGAIRELARPQQDEPSRA